MQIDVHQHIWPASLIAALRARSEPPRLIGWSLAMTGHPDYQARAADHDVAARAKQARDDGLDLVLISMSSAMGLESLPPVQAGELLEAYHEGAAELPSPFQAWAAAPLRRLDASALADQLDSGFVGLALPAGALLDEDGYKHLRPLLDVLVEAQKPLMIHPGPADGVPGSPAWWPAMVGYVQQMHAAWFAFGEYGRPRYPGLRVCFALLAGLAPLHGERFAARADQRSVVDPDVFLDTSSYGTRAIDATIRVLGIDVLVNGSDRPYAEPPIPDLGAAAVAAIRSSNPLRLIDPKEVTHGVVPAASTQP